MYNSLIPVYSQVCATFSTMNLETSSPPCLKDTLCALVILSSPSPPLQALSSCLLAKSLSKEAKPFLPSTLNIGVCLHAFINWLPLWLLRSWKLCPLPPPKNLCLHSGILWSWLFFPPPAQRPQRSTLGRSSGAPGRICYSIC